MSENHLTFKEFLKLPRKSQNERYKELSGHDKFLARMNDWGAPDSNKNKMSSGEGWRPSNKEAEEIMTIFNREASDK